MPQPAPAPMPEPVPATPPAAEPATPPDIPSPGPGTAPEDEPPTLLFEDSHSRRDWNSTPAPQPEPEPQPQPELAFRPLQKIQREPRPAPQPAPRSYSEQPVSIRQPENSSQPDTGYQGGNDYQNGNSYQGGNDYQGSTGYQNGSAYQGGSGGYRGGGPSGGSGGLGSITIENPGELILKIVAGISALVLLVRGVMNIFGGLQTAVNFLLIYYFDFLYILQGLLQALTGVAYLATAAILVLFILRKTREATDTLFAGLCGTSVLGTVLIVVNVLLNCLWQLIAGYRFHFYSAPLIGVLGLVVMLALIYGALWISGEMPLAGRNLNGILAELQNLPQAAGTIIGRLTGKIQQRSADIQSQRQQYGQQQYSQPPYGQQQYSQQPGRQAPPPPQPGPAPQSGPAYQAGAAPQPGPQYQARRPVTLRTDRSLLIYILLSVITCGIYSWYYLYCLIRDVNIACEGDGQKTGGLLALIFLTPITCGVYAYIWYYKLGNRLQQNSFRYGMMFPENGTTVLMWMIFGSLLCCIGPFVGLHILFKNTNAICAAYNASQQQ